MATNEKTETMMLHGSDHKLQYVSLAQASQITQLSPRTLRRAIAAQRLSAHRLGRLIRIQLSELERWVETNSVTSPSRLSTA